VERRYEERDFMVGIPTGLDDLDDYLLGWERGVFHAVGGYTSVGKTVIGLDLALTVLEDPRNREKGIRAAYFALEMTDLMLGRRMVASRSEQNLYRVRTGNLSEDGLMDVASAAARIGALGDRFVLSDDLFDIDEITAAIEREHKERGLDIVFIDYLQLIEGGDGSNREREVNKIGLALLRLAKRLKIAVIAFAQLNDGLVNRPGHRPTLQDMRESRAINHHARVVLLLHRPWLFERDNEQLSPCDGYVLIDKVSEGRTGEVQLHFNGSIMRWESGSCHPKCPEWPRTSKRNPAAFNIGGELEML
jgi:replicative DNA helicase